MKRPTVTLLASNAPWKGVVWNDGRRVQRCTFKEILRASSSHSFAAMPLERIVLEGPIESRDLLVLLSTLDPSFSGDVLYLPHAERGFLSAQADGGPRVMYPLAKGDIDFCIDVNQLRRAAEASSWRLATEPDAPPTRAMQVLIAEQDEPTIRSVTSVLGGLGCDSLIAESHLETIRLVGQRRPDVRGR
jgi:hypothetical protein